MGDVGEMGNDDGLEDNDEDGLEDNNEDGPVDEPQLLLEFAGLKGMFTNLGRTDQAESLAVAEALVAFIKGNGFVPGTLKIAVDAYCEAVTDEHDIERGLANQRCRRLFARALALLLCEQGCHDATATSMEPFVTTLFGVDAIFRTFVSMDLVTLYNSRGVVVAADHDGASGSEDQPAAVRRVARPNVIERDDDLQYICRYVKRRIRPVPPKPVVVRIFEFLSVELPNNKALRARFVKFKGSAPPLLPK
jgi:hypothetical protein